jgi:hypothetical protein
MAEVAVCVQFSNCTHNACLRAILQTARGHPQLFQAIAGHLKDRYGSPVADPG